MMMEEQYDSNSDDDTSPTVPSVIAAPIRSVRWSLPTLELASRLKYVWVCRNRRCFGHYVSSFSDFRKILFVAILMVKWFFATSTTNR